MLDPDHHDVVFARDMYGTGLEEDDIEKTWCMSR